MPADLRKPRRHIDPDTDNQDVLEDLVRYSQVLDTANAGVLLEESESSRQALSGDIFDIRMPLAKTPRIMIIDLQYALISTQTLSGTTESPELLKKKPDDPDDGISSSQSPEKETVECGSCNREAQSPSDIA